MPRRLSVRLSRRAVAALAAVVVALSVVVALAGGRHGDAERGGDINRTEGVARSDEEASRDPERVGSTSAGSEEAPPVGGFARDEEGAVAAAVSYAEAPQSWLYLSDDDVRGAVEAVVVPGRGGAELVEEVAEDVAILREALAEARGTVWFVVAALATKVERYNDSRASVGVWSVAVLSADDVAMPHSGWQITTVELEWHDGWRVAARRESDGPVPQLEPSQQPWSARYLDEELEGFQRVGAT